MSVCHREANREGLYGMYTVILTAFGPEIVCALKVRLSVCRTLLDTERKWQMRCSHANLL
jgi:hypothetical protein